jgi:hypothetical protein
MEPSNMEKLNKVTANAHDGPADEREERKSVEAKAADIGPNKDTTTKSDASVERTPTAAVPYTEQGPKHGIEKGDGPEAETQKKPTRKYEELDEGVKNASLTDNKNYSLIRIAMGLPEPGMLLWQEGYIPLGPFNNDQRFTLRRPTDRKTGKPLVEEHVPEFQYHLGKDISRDEALMIKTQYNELRDTGGPGRPSNNEEPVKFRAKVGEGVRRQFLAITEGKPNLPQKLASSDDEQAERKKRVSERRV